MLDNISRSQTQSRLLKWNALDGPNPVTHTNNRAPSLLGVRTPILSSLSPSILPIGLSLYFFSVISFVLTFSSLRRPKQPDKTLLSNSSPSSQSLLLLLPPPSKFLLDATRPRSVMSTWPSFLCSKVIGWWLSLHSVNFYSFQKQRFKSQVI